jgi:hypothetical protein
MIAFTMINGNKSYYAKIDAQQTKHQGKASNRKTQCVRAKVLLRQVPGYEHVSEIAGETQYDLTQEG